MRENWYFSSLEDLPEMLSREETMMYFKKYKSGDKTARDVLISRNIRLVIYIVNLIAIKGIYNCTKSDLVSIGLIGLIKAIDTFDLNKNVLFSTYADKCIKNEIIMFFRKNAKNLKTDSLESIFINKTTDDGENFYEQFLLDEKVNIEKQFIDDEIISQVMMIVSTLPEKDQKIIIMYFGLNNERRYNQEEIAKELNLSQSYLSRKIKQILELLKTICLMKGIIEYNSNLFEKKARKQRAKKA